MLTDVHNLIKRIEAFLETNEDFETVIEEDQLAIRVFPRNGEPAIYHGYELCLMESVVNKLGSALEFKTIKDDGYERFIVTTDANFNIASYVNSTNISLRSLQSDEINTVYLAEKLSDDGRGEFTILTGYTNGTWTRCDLTKAELLFAAVNDLEITQNENGIYWYNDLIDMSNKFFDEFDAFQAKA